MHDAPQTVQCGSVLGFKGHDVKSPSKAVLDNQTTTSKASDWYYRQNKVNLSCHFCCPRKPPAGSGQLLLEAAAAVCTNAKPYRANRPVGRHRRPVDRRRNGYISAAISRSALPSCSTTWRMRLRKTSCCWTRRFTEGFDRNFTVFPWQLGTC